MKPITLLLLLALVFSSCQKEKIIFVSDQYANNKSKSLNIRENEQDPWVEFSDSVAGFDYEEGYTYQLKVRIQKKESKVSYSLVEVLSKTKTTTTSIVDNQQEWFVLKIEGFKNKTDKTPSFTIKDGMIQGNTSCNSFGGSIQFDQTGIFKTGRLRYTKMYCKDYMSVEKSFSTALNRATNYKVFKGKLLVLDSEGKLLFTAHQKKEVAAIEKKWFVTSIKGFQNKTAQTPYFRISKIFINGNNGCNSFGGSFSTDAEQSFKIGDLRKTEMYCEEFAALEKAFHSALSQVTHYKITKGSLMLFDKSGYILMTASPDKPVVENASNKLPFVIKYNVQGKDYAITNKVIEAKMTLEYAMLLPKKTAVKNKALSKSDQKLFRNSLQKMDLESLGALSIPSKKYQSDAEAAANLVFIFKGKTYTVPTFDHGNPPKEVKVIVDRIMQIRERK